MSSQRHSSPAIIAVEKSGFDYKILTYTHRDDAPSFGMEAAQELGWDPCQVFKTLIIALSGGSHNYVCTLIPAHRFVDLKSVASAMRAKRAQLSEANIAERLSGYVVGGISPLGQKRILPTIVDSSALEHEKICFSAGRRGMSIAMNPHHAIEMMKAATEKISRDHL